MTKQDGTILVIEDEPAVCTAIAKVVRSMGHKVLTAHDAVEGIEKISSSSGKINVVVLDIQLPGMNGLEALPKIRSIQPDVEVIVITAYGTMETAMKAIQQGAYEYLLKPIDIKTLKTVISSAVEHHRRKNTSTKDETIPANQWEIIGKCPEMQEVFKQSAVVAGTDMPVLIQGDTGTGKELLARAIHRYSKRANGPFVPVNCSLLSGELIASELFGHEKGAFTGADKPSIGKVEIASGGTLLLDEIGDLSDEAQARLLRFLDNGEFYRVGSATLRRADVRIIAASNRPLRAAAMSGQFRRDLFFRISSVTIELPPLKERGQDIDLLIDYFLHRFKAAGITPQARELLKGYSFPGNVRELRNIIAAAVTMAGHRPIEPEHLPEEIRRSDQTGIESLDDAAEAMLDKVLQTSPSNAFEELQAAWEKPLLSAAMKKFHRNQAKIAAALNIHRTTLRRKLRKYGLIS